MEASVAGQICRNIPKCSMCQSWMRVECSVSSSSETLFLSYNEMSAGSQEYASESHSSKDESFFLAGFKGGVEILNWGVRANSPQIKLKTVKCQCVNLWFVTGSLSSPAVIKVVPGVITPLDDTFIYSVCSKSALPLRLSVLLWLLNRTKTIGTSVKE